MTADECLRAAWKALLRGDLAERDRYCALATNIISAERRVRESGDLSKIVEGAAICLPDRSKESMQ